jgi:FMN phosphatase YigB (HAD superfamily)
VGLKVKIMTLTLLLDLDDTLLNTNLDVFAPAYFQALSKHLASRIKPEVMLPALMSGTRLMNESEDFTRTLEEVFDAEFYPKIGIPKAELEDRIDDFYDNVFPTLGKLTSPRPEARPFLDWAFEQGFRITIATDPLLPTKATRHRIRFAGLDPDRFELISTFDYFYFSKTYPAYYAEVLGRLGWPEGPVLMVGNDMERDIIPARKLGLAAYHIDGAPASGTGLDAVPGGKLSDLRPWLESTDLSALEPDFKSPESIMSIMAASPAILSGMSQSLSMQGWTREPTPDDWALTEIVCHLRDTEREIHHQQIKMFNDQPDPFIPRPDSSVWARERKYLDETGVKALADFAATRKITLAILKGLTPTDWSRSGRHAIFGPTNFREVIGFIAEHDRMHIQQAWRTLQST